MTLTFHPGRQSTEKKLLLICFTVFFFLSQSALADILTFSGEENRKTYSNPVDARSLPDPTIIKGKDGWFYLYATENIRHVPILRSKNLTQWEQTGTAFTKETRPDFEPKASVWAPDINYFNKKYVMYYSMSVWGGEWTCGVGVASADKPEGPFTDHGKLFRSNEINVKNSIDPFFIEENCKKYLFWGSFRGIYYIELNKDGLALKKGSEPKQIAGTAFEGTYIYKRKGFYYFFASVGSCCAGLNSTYRLVVGRSKKLLGPYVDRVGNAMMENGFEVVIDKNDRFLGNGHNAEIVQDDAGRDWILYHGIDVNEPKKRVLMLDEIMWDNDGWPYVRNSGTPSLEAEAPVFK
jgi:arabinan endo-1,5-alpha-L-arabinosidase